MENVHFIFCDIQDSLCKQWNIHIRKLDTNLQKHFTVFNDRLSEYPGKFDCIVSPGNAQARLDGSFDYFISDMFCHDNPSIVTDFCQETLYAIYNGYQVPGTCLLIPMHNFSEQKFKCRYIAHCPTMRTPSNCKWNKEIVYNCMWSLLCEIERHNIYRAKNKGNDIITSVFMTGLGTGVGGFSSETCAAQMVLAYKHFIENKIKVSNCITTTSWNEAYAKGIDIDETIRNYSFLTSKISSPNDFLKSFKNLSVDSSSSNKNDEKENYKEIDDVDENSICI